MKGFTYGGMNDIIILMTPSEFRKLISERDCGLSCDLRGMDENYTGTRANISFEKNLKRGSSSEIDLKNSSYSIKFDDHAREFLEKNNYFGDRDVLSRKLSIHVSDRDMSLGDLLRKEFCL